jgi:hypothetical protein
MPQTLVIWKWKYIVVIISEDTRKSKSMHGLPRIEGQSRQQGSCTYTPEDSRPV